MIVSTAANHGLTLTQCLPREGMETILTKRPALNEASLTQCLPREGMETPFFQKYPKWIHEKS